MTVLQVGPLMPALSTALAARYDARELPDAFTDDEFDDVTVAVTSGRTGVDAALMKRLPALRAIINFGVGYDTTDVAEAGRRGIAVSNTPDVLDDCVADTAVGLTIDVMRGLSAADRHVRRGDWPAHGNPPLARKVSGARVGILGLGRIGLAVATRLTGFGCDISYHNRTERSDVPYRYAGSVTELAGAVDVLIVTVSGGAHTRHLVSADVLAALGPDGFLVNVSRGSVVDEDALVAALVDGRLAGAGLDTFADEPHVPPALFGLDRVVLTPHLGSGTVETRQAMADLVLANLDRFLADGTLVTPV
ncbi:MULTISPECIES: 2-hydroxyacid dehydrogenase [Catenuloplanes]|uniref:Lactate dehydrogenase-like 2-hydroxyacid dehydrogenase n=1 Tax=Catenuloplanes niger TaxID=587534 RepID=A0AAE3ZJ66_9ACTN|nr:2-hydroxyacid dehydrogenase [Catenuloplanes niger]MDR7319982.1 lactate dehydrogenase-like 2-hydroxyacid dehydrogenase [Catenuloplanes niger]